MSTDPFGMLPDEVLVSIFEYLLRNDPLQNLAVDRHWRRLSQDATLWKQLYSHFIGNIPATDLAIDYRKQCLTILRQYRLLSDKQQQLGFSVYHGYEQLVNDFLKKNPNADLYFKNERKENLIHVIHLAAMQGHTNLINIILVNNPNALSIKDIVGWTPLHYACHGGHTEMVKKLLIEKSPVDLTDNDTSLKTEILIFNKTKLAITTEGKQKLPLHLAAEKGYLPIVKLLLNYIKENKFPNSAVLDKQDSESWTALHYACANGHEEIVKELIAAGASTKLTTKAEKTILHLACAYHHIPIAEYLPTVNRQLVYALDNVGWSIMHYACAIANLRLVKFFKSYGVPVLQLTIDNRAPFELVPSKAKDREEILKVLAAQNEAGHTKLKTIKNRKNIVLSGVLVITLLTLTGAIVLPSIPKLTAFEPLLTTLLPILLAVFAVITGVGMAAYYHCSMKNFRHEVATTNPNTENLTNDLVNEKTSLLGRESKVGSYITFPEEIFTVTKSDKIVTSDLEEGSLVDQRNNQKPAQESVIIELENSTSVNNNPEIALLENTL